MHQTFSFSFTGFSQSNETLMYPKATLLKMDMRGSFGYYKAGTMLVVIGIMFGIIGYLILLGIGYGGYYEPWRTFWPEFLEINGSVLLALGIAVIIVGYFIKKTASQG
jgi:hypothetical protein